MDPAARDLSALTIRSGGDELDLDEPRAKALIDAACAQVGVDERGGSLIERVNAARKQRHTR